MVEPSQTHPTLRQYEIFVAIAEELHFGRAAERFGVAQPALTQQLKLLEEAFGGELLFDRNRRRVRLTEFGATVLPEARALLRQARRVESVARLMAEGRGGRLEIGYVGSASYAGVLSRTLRTFLDGVSDVELVLQELDMDLQIHEIQSGRMDAGFVRLPVPGTPDNVRTLSILEEEIILAVSSSHRLAGSDSVKMTDLMDERFIFTHLGPDTGFAACAYALCSDASFTPNIVHRARQFTAIVSFVSAGLGVALVPASAARMDDEGVKFVRISDAARKSRIGLAYLDKPTNPALWRFLKTLPA